VVEEVIREHGNAWTLVLRPQGHAGLSFQPGQFAWLTIWNSPFADKEHPFSFSSSAAQPQRLAFTIKALGDFTSRIQDVRPGERVYLDGPHGGFSIERHPHATGYVFIAGGIGVTPIMSMLRTLADRGDQRPLLLIYANKDWDSVTFREQIDGLQDRLNLQVVHVLENPPQGWEGERGYVTPAMLDRYLPKNRAKDVHEIFICGPQVMMDAVERALVEMGIALGDFHSERFDLV
jgi:3-phenylpropionate/trans-cinnamate dioxygenase ferredoxin reductase subunit